MARTALVRLRWRLAGAWQWPSFVVLTLVDAVVIHWLPPVGDSEGLVGAWLVALVSSLIVTAVVGVPLSLAIRWRRADLPQLVARNYAATCALVALALGLATAGVVHHRVITRDRAAMYEAAQEAEAWIGDHAPSRFLVNLHRIDTFAIQPTRMYRSCVQSAAGQSYCVVVDRSRPWGAGVRPDGHEPNSLLEQGAN